MSPGTRGRRAAVLAGVFAVAAATLMYEILLTRIFSVTMWYHFAFLAVAAALLGMTLGAVLVQARPRTFSAAAAPRHLATSALFFAIGVPATFLLHLAIPVVPTLTTAGLLSVLITYAFIAVPFVASGVCICLALTRLPGPVSSIYAADLAGAACGCLATVGALKIADAPAAVFLVAALAAAGAGAFAVATGARRALAAALVLIAATLALGGTAASWLRLTWVKGGYERGPTLYERWNSYSRIRVSGDLEATSPPFGWGLSPTYRPTRHVGQLLLSIDAIADTVLTRLDGSPAALDYLRYDVTNLAHYLRSDGRVLVVGAGGGRDVLSALAFGQRHVVAVEVNEAILDALNHVFGAYTGHLDRRPSVQFVNDEARSYVARLDQRFDIIQVSFIDTFAASAAGAYVLTEHSLYTVEAWRTFLDRLSPDGILTFSRWHFHRFPAEIWRLVALGTTSLLESGVSRPRDHMVLVRTERGADPRYPTTVGVGTLLVARQPFSDRDLAAVRELATRLGFEVLLDPQAIADPILADLASPERLGGVVARSALDISPPTDDRPFFFHTVPLGRALRFTATDQGNVSFNTTAVLVLVGGFALTAGLTIACLAGVIAVRRRHPEHGAITVADATFFAAIGLGYILVEISQLERLTVVLGHPTLGLVVVLFALLLSSGMGSFAVGRWPTGGSSLARAAPIMVTPAVLAAFGALTPIAIPSLWTLPTPWRITLAVAAVAPIGFAMGMVFPRGLEMVRSRAPAATPWLWAVNGVASVLGSLAAVLISISAGISTAFWSGTVAYVAAAAAALWMGERVTRGHPPRAGR
ncbi:MAG: hypothetical protein DMD78_17695 [Candidatus Rokuibacteriota bacterium]|nr:MAG: hypothetical protein DMD78_17695 [Candidatus Rokubacteria bacterium]